MHLDSEYTDLSTVFQDLRVSPYYLTNFYNKKKEAEMAKPELEFFNTETIPWKPIKGSPGQYEKILSIDTKTGSYTRLLLSEPDLEKIILNKEEPLGKVLSHEDMWEEVFVISGTGFGTSINKTFNNKTYRSGYYACRPPGMKHGPFLHPTGAICIEVRTKVN